MANNNCDDIFNEIQDLQVRRQQLNDSRDALHSSEQTPPPADDTSKGNAKKGRKPLYGPEPPDPARTFLAGRDPETGKPLVVDVSPADDMLRQVTEGRFRGEAIEAVDGLNKPLGREGEFENLKRIVDAAGREGAADIYEVVLAVMGKLDEYKPEDLARIKAVNSSEIVAQRIADAFAEGTERADMGILTQAVARDAAPFVNLLDKQTRVVVMDVVARDNLLDKLTEIRDQIEATKQTPGPDAMRELDKAAVTAIATYRMSAMVRRISGQLLQQLQNNYQSVAPGVVGKMLKDELLKERIQTFKKGSNLLTDDTIAGQARQAASLGLEGVKDLNDLIAMLKREGVQGTLDKDWRSTLKIQARAYHKDSMLFNMNTQAVANYLSNKITYFYEGYKSLNITAAEFFYKTGEARPDNWNWSDSLIKGGFIRNVAESTYESVRAHHIISELTDDVVRQATRDALGDAMPTGLWADYRGKWKQVIQKGIVEGRNPFGDAAEEGLNVDVNSGQSRSIQEEWKIADQVLYGRYGRPSDPKNLIGSAALNFGAELKNNPAELPFLLRDRMHLGTKIVLNHLTEAAIFRATGKKVELPLTSALQTLAAVDSRAGARTYIALRAKDLFLQTIEREPDFRVLSWEKRKAEVAQALKDEIYSADPSAAQVEAYRKQMGAPDMSEQDVRARIIAKHVGAPVLDSPDKLAALEFSRRMRMQTPPETAWVKRLDSGIQELRKNSYVDAALPFWRAGFSGASYVLEEAAMPVKATWDFFQREVVPGQSQAAAKAKLAAGWLIYGQLVAAVGIAYSQARNLIVGSPEPGEDPRQFSLRNRAQTIANVPGLASIPLAGIILTIQDVYEAADKGALSKFDKIDLYQSLGQAFLGQLYRGAGFGQVRELVDTIASGDPRRLQDFMAFMVNGQVNPASGLMRQAERGVGFVQAGTGLNERFADAWLKPTDYALRDRMRSLGGEWNRRADEMPGYNALDGIVGFLRNLNGTTSTRPLKTTDYLGRDLRTPSGWFQEEYMPGFPGLYNSHVHNNLKAIGMLLPPKPLLDGRLDGIPMSAQLSKEFNHYVGHSVGGKISDDPKFKNQVYFRIRGGRYDETTGELKPYERSIPLGDFMDNLTDGRTLHGALNALFQSPQWETWIKDPTQTLVPKLSTNPTLADAPKAELKQRLPGRVVSLLHQYYAAEAEEAILASPSSDAADWRALRQARLMMEATPESVKQQSLDQLQILNLR